MIGGGLFMLYVDTMQVVKPQILPEIMVDVGDKQMIKPHILGTIDVVFKCIYWEWGGQGFT
jgi:hypothetical protein